MDGAGYISAVAKLYGIIVDDVKESEIVDTDTNKVLGQVYILCCFGSVENFEKLKKRLLQFRNRVRGISYNYVRIRAQALFFSYSLIE